MHYDTMGDHYQLFSSVMLLLPACLRSPLYSLHVFITFYKIGVIAYICIFTPDHDATVIQDTQTDIMRVIVSVDH